MNEISMKKKQSNHIQVVEWKFYVGSCWQLDNFDENLNAIYVTLVFISNVNW